MPTLSSQASGAAAMEGGWGLDGTSARATAVKSRSFTASSRQSSAGSNSSQRSTPVDTRFVQLYVRPGSIHSLSDARRRTSAGLDSRPDSADCVPDIPGAPISIPSIIEQGVGGDGRTQSVPGFGRQSLSNGNGVGTITDYLYIGGIEAAYNQNMLCKLNIEYIVDMSNVERGQLPKAKRSDCPCLCPRATGHSISRMTISIGEETTADLLGYFQDVNDFISKARKGGKSVLLNSYLGRNRCAVFAVQHLVAVRRLRPDQAEELVRTACPRVAISDNFRKPLRKWAEKIARTGLPLGTQVLMPTSPYPPPASRSPTSATRQAWT